MYLKAIDLTRLDPIDIDVEFETKRLNEIIEKIRNR